MKTKLLYISMLFVLIGVCHVQAQVLDLEFAMPTTMMVPGSPCSLDLNITNSGAAINDATLFVALNIGTDDYWFYPSWAHFPSEVDSAQIDVSASETDIISIMPEFAWPTGTGEFTGALFIGAVLSGSELISDIAQIDFGWTKLPETYQAIECNTDWIEGTVTETARTMGYSFNATEAGTYYIWWDDASEGSGTMTADINVSAYQMDKTTAYFQEVDMGYTASQSIVVATGETLVNVMVKAENNSEGSYGFGVTFFPHAPDKSVNARQTAAWMSGDFDTYEQSQQQPSYYDITLRMKRIWPDLTDGYWLYVEQAVKGNLPYRQRVYRVRMESDTLVASEVYSFINEADEDAAVGAWQDDNPLSDLTPASLEQKTGCEVLLERVDVDTMNGGTQGKDCSSTLNGATYATSDVTVIVDQLTSWDRGYNANDVQVWGAVDGPYIFDKLDNFNIDLDL